MEYETDLQTFDINCSKTNTYDPGFKGQVHTASLAVCTVLIIFAVLMGCIGNGIVLISALKWKKLRTNFDLLILNLAGADFLTCTCLSPVFMFLLYTEPETPASFCGSILFLGTVSGMLSLFTLEFIALHRVSRVLGFTKKSMSLKRTGCVLLVIWMLSLSMALGGTLHVTHEWREETRSCQSIINSGDRWSQNFVLFFLAPVVVVSFVFIAVSYLVICRTVHNQSRSLVEDRCKCYLHPFKTAAGYEKDKLSSNHQDTILCSCVNHLPLNKENKALTLCLVVILTIGLCWGPLIISQFVELFTGESIILYQVKLCGIGLLFLNSALDPYVYAQHIGQMKQKYCNGFRNFAKIVSCGGASNRMNRSNQYHKHDQSPKTVFHKYSSNTSPLLGPNEKANSPLGPGVSSSTPHDSDHYHAFPENTLSRVSQDSMPCCTMCQAIQQNSFCTANNLIVNNIYNHAKGAV